MRFRYSYRKKAKLSASGDPYQIPHSVASDFGLQFASYLFRGLLTTLGLRKLSREEVDKILGLETKL